MKIVTSNIVFASKIKLIDTKQFNNKLQEYSSSLQKVDYPWTIETMKKGNALYTDRLMDCIAICLTNGVDSILAHLGIRDKKRAEIDSVKEFDIINIEQCLSNKINLDDNNLHGIIFGGMQIEEDFNTGNTPQLNQIKNLFQKYKIPFSIIGARKDIHFFGRYSLLFDQDNDTLFITNNHFDSYGIHGEREHKEIELNYEGMVDYNVYKQNQNKQGFFINKKRVRTTVEEYFKSQFRQVELNNIDRYV